MKKVNKRFVMLGERNSKGRIVKNESFSINDFLIQISHVKNIKLKHVEISFSIFELMFKPKKVKKRFENYMFETFKEFSKAYSIALHLRINEMIEHDSFGKKKK